MSRIVKINDYKMAEGDPKILICPECKCRDFVVVTIKEKRKVSIVKLACAACKARLDVMSGFVS